MLSYVIATTTLTRTMVHDIFHLNPPVLHVFDKQNANPWSPFSGVTVFVFIWSVFFGNAFALVFAGAVQLGVTLGEFDPYVLGAILVAYVGVIVFGIRAMVPPLRAILNTLHGIELKLGWPRHLMAVTAMVVTFLVNHSDQFLNSSEQDNDLIGPTYANAIDGETLFMNGLEVNLFGIDAVERDQICQTMAGEDYPCGRQARQSLQEIVQNHRVICAPMVHVNERRVLAMCELHGPESPQAPEDFIGRFRVSSLSRIMVEEGHAVSIGIGATIFLDEQRQAQTLRKGIWQGSFLPPRLWRSEQSQ